VAADTSKRNESDVAPRTSPVWEADPRFRIAVEAMLDGLAIYSSIRDARGEIVDLRCEYANQAAVANGGLAPDAQVGRTMRETFPGIVESGLFAAHVRVVETGEPAIMDVPWYEDAGAAGAFELRTARLDDGCVIVFRDVTERNRTEAALRASETRLDTFLQALPIGVAVVDAEGPVFVNRFGLELFGDNVRRDLPLHDIAARYSLIRYGTDETYPLDELPLTQALRGVTAEADDVAIRRPDRDVPVDSFATPLHDDDGDVVAAISVFRDATERRTRDEQLKEALADLAQANAELSEFAAHAAHDLAEPLRAIAGFTDLLRRRYGARLDEEALDWLDLMLDGAARMHALIDDLVAYSRAGSVLYEPASVDLGAVLEMAREALSGTLDEAGAMLEIGELPVVSGDASQLVRLFQNLLTNAVKFARPDVPPQIAVTATRRGDAWAVTVTDNGRGVPENERERVFAPFQRVGSDAEPGSGLGLAICRRIAERHSGQLRLDPGGDVGSRFCVTLPAS
jgi:signal transduction histidine kinase